MANPFVGEIRMFGGNFPPSGWALCNGQLLSIAQNEALFNLIGTTYGGDGQSTFQLPDLRGRVPIHQGQGLGLSSYVMGQIGGAETVTLTASQMPAHSHQFVASTSNVLDTPAGDVLSSPPPASGVELYAEGSPNGLLNPNSNIASGESQAHSNLMPYLTTNFIISLFGIFPSQN
jgi:microcystin-dependent protein